MLYIFLKVDRERGRGREGEKGGKRRSEIDKRRKVTVAERREEWPLQLKRREEKR